MFSVVVIFLGSGVFTIAEAVDAPTAFTATATSSCAIQLDWGDTTNPAGTTYDAQRKSTGGFITSTNIPFQEGEGTYSFVDSHADSPWLEIIDPGTAYEYKIRAVNANTAPPQSSWAGPQGATTLSLPPQPGLPVSVTSTVSDGTGNIEVSWVIGSPTSDLFAGYGNFEVWAATSDNGSMYTSFSRLESVPGDPARIVSGKFFYETLSNDKDLSYQYKIRAQEVGGLGCDNTRHEHIVLSADSDVLTIPRRPNIDYPNTQFVSEQGKITFAWNDNQSSPNETGFEIHRSTFSDFNPHITISAAVDATSYDDTSIIQSPPTTYHYRIRSCINDTCSFWSDTVVVTTGLPVIADLNLRISYATAVDAITTLMWIPEAIVNVGSELRIERATLNTAFQEIAQLGTGAEERGTGVYLDEQLPLGETYTYRIRVCDAAGADADCSGPSDQPSTNLDLLYILKGAAWAAQTGPEGVGWIKFNSASEGGSTPSSILYSVQIDKDGLVTGNAWAGEYGWLSFHPEDLVGCESGTCEARFSSDINQFSGWARFLAPEDFVGESSWDGWVKLRGITQTASLDSPFSTLASLFDTSLFTKSPFSVFTSLFDFATAHAQSSYGVQLGTCVDKECPLTGQAWGNELVGWIGFGSDTCGIDGGGNPKCTARAELINESPAVANVTVTTDSLTWCALTPVYEIRWEYSDPDEDPMQSAEIKFIDPGGSIDLTIPYIPYSTSNYDQLFMYLLSNPLGFDDVAGTYSLAQRLASSIDYRVIVEVSDGFDVTASLPSVTFTTPSHYGPYIQDPSIVWDPETPELLDNATSTAMVNDRSGLVGIQEYAWTFEVANPSSATTIVSSTQVRILSGTVTTTIAITDSLDDEFSFCAVDQSYWFSDEGSIATKRRVFRER